MEVIEIKPNGFCSGVVNAIKTIKNIINDSSFPKPIYMFGHLVHNKKIVSSFDDDIIAIKENFNSFLDTIKKGTILFTAHGISPKIKEKAISLKNDSIRVVDTTCFNVLKIHTIINSYLNQNENNHVVVIGKETHPEILGFLGISSNVLLYKEGLVMPDYSLIVNQTTLVDDDVQIIFNKLKKQNPTIMLNKKICNATKLRQNAIKNNLSCFDFFLVIGDPLSNNCDSLYNIIKREGKIVYKIEGVEDLNRINLENVQKIAVTAAASTPSCIVREVIKELESYSKGKVFTTKLSKKDYIDI